MSIKWWNSVSAPLYLHSSEDTIRDRNLVIPDRNDEDEIVEEFAQLLVDLGIQLINFDYDNTLVETPDPKFPQKIKDDKMAIQRYRQRITPLFAKLIKAFREKGLYFSICTYNVSKRLKLAFENIYGDGMSIPVYARNDKRNGTGKLWHMMQPMQSLNNNLRKKYGENYKPLRPQNALLIDDLHDNIATCEQMGFNFIHNKSVITKQDLADFIALKRRSLQQTVPSHQGVLRPY
jgi:predicted HAD superfamily phosphohydrolase YqeG